MDIKERYKELWSFLISHFGDYWEGKSEKDILDEAIQKNSKDYLDKIRDLNTSLISDKDYSIEEKNKFLLSANIYFKKDSEAIDWLLSIDKLFLISA